MAEGVKVSTLIKLIPMDSQGGEFDRRFSARATPAIRQDINQKDLFIARRSYAFSNPKSSSFNIDIAGGSPRISSSV